MGPTSDGRGASGMSRIGGNLPQPGLKKAHYSMKMAFPLRFRLIFCSSLFFATAYSAVP
jgi:hypothetical protein